MVLMQINITDEIHKKLKKQADENLRSMKNELMMIVKKSLNKVELEQLEVIEPKKNLLNMESRFMA